MDAELIDCTAPLDLSRLIDPTRCPECRETPPWCGCDWAAKAAVAQEGAPEIFIDIRNLAGQ